MSDTTRDAHGRTHASLEHTLHTYRKAWEDEKRNRTELEAEVESLRKLAAHYAAVADEHKAEVERLRGLLGELVDTGDCQYDHHGYCQAHKLDPRPCPNERAITLLALPAPRHYCRCKTCRAARRPTPRTDG